MSLLSLIEDIWFHVKYLIFLAFECVRLTRLDNEADVKVSMSDDDQSRKMQNMIVFDPEDLY